MKRLKDPPSESYEYSSSHFSQFITLINNSAKKDASGSVEGNVQRHFTYTGKIWIDILPLSVKCRRKFHRHFTTVREKYGWIFSLIFCVSKMSLEISTNILFLYLKKHAVKISKLLKTTTS